jgi:hypothetical protein
MRQSSLLRSLGKCGFLCVLYPQGAALCHTPFKVPQLPTWTIRKEIQGKCPEILELMMRHWNAGAAMASLTLAPLPTECQNSQPCEL